jgi:hypothetical protein
LNSSPQLLARGRAERGAWPGRICGWTRPPTLPSADVGRSTAVLVFVVRPAGREQGILWETSRWKFQATISTNSTNLAGVDRATGDEVKSSTAMRVLAQCKKEPRLVNSKRGRKCGQGQNRTADTRIFQSSCCTRTKCHYRSLLVSIQAFNGAVRRSILPIRTGIGALSSNTVTQPTFP